ncbi:MAG: glutathione binding-like protein [Pseudomonadota bacterium]
MIEFYYAPTPNGWKVGIMLEECGLDYELHLMRLAEGDQFTSAFREISPNAKMPAIRDRAPPSAYGPEPVTVFESGAILLYLAEKTGRFGTTDPLGRKSLMEWMFWQVGNQGPMGGQLSHFRNYAPSGQDYGRDRYGGEYERNLAVLDTRLSNRPFILGNDYTIADMLAFPWAFIAKPLGADLGEFPAVADWRRRIKARPAVQRAIDLAKGAQNRGQHNASNTPLLYNQGASHLRDRPS